MQGIRRVDREAGRIGARSVSGAAGKKTAQVAVERDTEVRRILDQAASAKHADLEAWEHAIRSAVLVAGGKALSGLLADIGSGRRGEPVVCSCGVRMESRGLQAKPLLSILGPVAYSRSIFRCPACGETRCPGDEELDVVEKPAAKPPCPGRRKVRPKSLDLCSYLPPDPVYHRLGPHR